MSDAAPHPITTMPVVCRLPGMDAVAVREDLTYRAADGHPQPLAVYRPPAPDGHGRLPAVILVAGYPDEGMARILGCRFMDMASTRSRARLMAASGLVAVTCTNREPAAFLGSTIPA